MSASRAETAHPAIVVLGARGGAVAGRVRAALKDAQIWAPAGAAGDADVRYDGLAPTLRALFQDGRPILGVCAAGILVRALAPVLSDKHAEPPVLALAEDGSAVVPLLGGHRGANELARRIGLTLGVTASVTTASDARFGVALDEPPPGWRVAEPAHVAPFVAALLEGARARLVVEAGDAGWLREARLALAPDGPLEILITAAAVPQTNRRLVYHPPVLALGVGTERGAAPEALVELALATLAERGLAAAAVACVVSLDLKAAEPAVHVLAARFGVPARFLARERLLEQTARLASPSAAVFAETGCWGVAEGAALAAVGPEGELIVPKRKGERVTCAVALAPGDIDPGRIGRARGRLSIVGLGPGGRAGRTRAAEAAIRSADAAVGYRLYLDLAADLLGGIELHPFELGEEEARCRRALELAATGRRIALLASGDPGIYAMASLALELIERERDAAWERVELAVVPGVSAMQAAAAAAGAPLGHDFAVVSLSDLMTPWEVIERRLEAVASADMALALYNPVSARRREGLARARTVLLRHRAPDTPVIVARNLGRDGETVRVLSLAALATEDVDMLTTVIVGGGTTRAFIAPDGRTRVYTPRGYRLGG